MNYPAYGTNYATTSRKRERAYNADRPYNTVAGSAAYVQSPYGYHPAAANGYYNYISQPAAAPLPRSTPYDYSAAPYPRYRRPSDPGPQPQGRPPYSDTKRAKKAGREAISKGEDEFRKVRGVRPIGNVGSVSGNIPKVPANTPNFIFVSLSSHDVLKITNLSSIGDSESFVKEALKLSWRDGFAEESLEDDGSTWCLTLGGDVWTASGIHGIKSRRYICQLFKFFAEEGLSYLTTTGNHPFKAPKMVFTSNNLPNPEPDYFMISFSSNHRTMHIIDAPKDLAESIGKAVGISNKPLPPRPGELRQEPSRTNAWLTTGVYEVPTNPDFNQDLAVLMATSLRLIASQGWQFEASVPFGRCGLFGYKGRREVWMFRRMLTPEEERYAGFKPAFPDEHYWSH